MSVAENPNRKGMLFAGTGHDFFYSLDDGAHWTMFNEGPAAYRGVVDHRAQAMARRHRVDVRPGHFHSARHRAARADRPNRRRRRACSIRRIRDIDRRAPAAPTSRSLSKRLAPTGAHRDSRLGEQGRAHVAGADARRIQSCDSGIFATIRRASSRCARRRRTTRDIFEEPRFRNRPTRPITHWGIQGAQTSGPLALPGKYTVRLIVNGKTESQPLTILKDPEIKTVDADLVASTQTQVRVRDDLNATADMVNKLEVMRKQILDQRKANAEKADVVSALAELDKKMLAVELQLISHSDMNSDDKYYVEPYKVYMNLIWLNGVVGNGAGDVAGGSDFAPTESALGWLGDIEKDLDAAKGAYKKLIDSDLDEFNKRMTGRFRRSRRRCGRWSRDRTVAERRLYEYCIPSAMRAAHTRGLGDSWIDVTGAGCFPRSRRPFYRTSPSTTTR